MKPQTPTNRPDVTERIEDFLGRVREIIGDRGKQHRDSHHVAEDTAKIAKILIKRDPEEWDASDGYKFMIAFKAARIANGVSFMDSVIDMVGYLFLLDDYEAVYSTVESYLASNGQETK